MFAFALVLLLLGQDVSSASSGPSFGGLIDADSTTPPRRLLPHPGAHHGGGHRPHPHNVAGGHVSSEHGYQGCLGLTDEELTSVTIGAALASEIGVTELPPCQVVVSGGGDGSTSDLYQSHGSSSSSEDSTGSSSPVLTKYNETSSWNANDGSNLQDEPSSNTYLDQDDPYDENGAQNTSGSSNPYNISFDEQGGDGEVDSSSSGVSQSSSVSDELSTDEADGASSSTQGE